MLNFFLPSRTYRRLIASLLAAGIRKPSSVIYRLSPDNWKNFQKYRQTLFTCNVCSSTGSPFFDFPDLKLRSEHVIAPLRETLQCKICGATMRHRSLASMLLNVIAEKKGRHFRSVLDLSRSDSMDGLRILDTDAYSPISNLLRSHTSYMVSSFHPGKPFDLELSPGHYNLNLEKIGFPDQSLDIVLTSDVMEHVRNVDLAHQEITRVLKEGGHYIFTVPYDSNLESHRILVDTSGHEDKFLVPPHYHGDPITGGILAYRIFGKQIFRDMTQYGMDLSFSLETDAKSLIIDGDVFVARKINIPSPQKCI